MRRVERRAEVEAMCDSVEEKKRAVQRKDAFDYKSMRDEEKAWKMEVRQERPIVNKSWWKVGKHCLIRPD